jgi:O-antigen biosynthesis protein WbqP
MLKRIFDVLIVLVALVILLIPLIVVALAVRATSSGPIVHWSKRVGRFNKLFLMPKFRTMKTNTPQVATHLLTNPEQYLTPVGSFLRKTSLDELPQLFSVLTGDMSFVGPRPALFSQDDLVGLRTRYGIEQLRPGITGWAQVNGRDELPIPVKVEFDRYYLEHQSLWLDIKILFITAFKVLRSEGVQHKIAPRQRKSILQGPQVLWEKRF